MLFCINEIKYKIEIWFYNEKPGVDVKIHQCYPNQLTSSTKLVYEHVQRKNKQETKVIHRLNKSKIRFFIVRSWNQEWRRIKRRNKVYTTPQHSCRPAAGERRWRRHMHLSLSAPYRSWWSPPPPWAFLHVQNLRRSSNLKIHNWWN